MNRASFDPRNTHEKKFRAYEDKMAPWHEIRDVAQDPRNLAHSFREKYWGNTLTVLLLGAVP